MIKSPLALLTPVGKIENKLIHFWKTIFCFFSFGGRKITKHSKYQLKIMTSKNVGIENNICSSKWYLWYAAVLC